MLKSILLGAALVAMTVGIHALGTTLWIKYLWRRRIVLAEKKLLARSLEGLTLTALVLLSLHVLEVTLWAVSYFRIAGVERLATFEEAFYFSMVTFTTLGFGDITLDPPWRILSAIEAMNGILLFGWSTALFFAVVQRIWAMDVERSKATTSSRDSRER